MDTEYAVRFRHVNGTIHRTIILADGSADLFTKMEEGRSEVLSWAILRPSDDRRDLESIVG